MKPWMALLLLSLMTAVPAVATACPNCKDAVAAGTGEPGDTDPLREARAYNNSVYFMVSVPYLVLGTLGVVGYRAYCKAQAVPPPGED